MTACTPSDRILQTLRTHVPGSTDAMLELELFNVMDYFFRRTSAWRHYDDVTLEQGVIEYSYGVPAGAAMVRMLGMTHNNLPIPYAGQNGSTFVTGTGVLDPARTFVDGDAVYAADAAGDLPIDDANANTFSWAIYRPDMITISVPSSEITQYPAKLWMALSLAKECLECDGCGDWVVPEWVWSMFFQDFLDGTLSSLYAMPSKPWTSEKHALMHGRRFRNQMAFRKQEAPRGFIHGAPGPWRFPGSWSR